MKAPNHGASVLKAAEALGQQAKCTAARGLICIMEHDDGTQTTSVFGTFDSDLEKATNAIKASFGCLLGHSACADTNSQLPRRLRKEHRDEEEHECKVVACTKRR